MKKSWKTTLGGILAAAGLSMQTNEDHSVQVAGWIIAALGAAILGLYSKDKDVTGGTKAATTEADNRIN